MQDKFKIKRLQVIVRTIGIRTLEFFFVSFAIFFKTVQVSSYILIKLQIELKCDPQRVSPALFTVPTWFLPLPITISPLSNKFAISLTNY